MRPKRLSPSAPARPAVALLACAALSACLGACGPTAAIPPLPAIVPGTVADTSITGHRAKALAPVLYLQRDETFQLSRAVAVVHPDSAVIAYHLLWRDDVHGAWLPFTVATDQEIVWVGHDASGAPVRIWTYWHGNVLTTPWPKRQVAVDVQWGKHGSLPHNTNPDDLPAFQSLGMFYAFAWALPDIWLSRLNREGPLCFCRGFARYREFTQPTPLGPRLDAVVVARDPGPALRALFGERYSEKPAWPWLLTGGRD